MLAVAIYDTWELNGGNVLAFDLIDLLRLLVPAIEGSSWRCRSVECTGSMSNEMHDACDSGATLSNTEMFRLAENVHQVIDGDFEASCPGDSRPWLVIRAVDSTFYVVICNEADVIQRIRDHFKVVRDSPQDAEYF